MDDAAEAQTLRERLERQSEHIGKYLEGKVTVIGDTPSRLRRYPTK